MDRLLQLGRQPRQYQSRLAASTLDPAIAYATAFQQLPRLDAIQSKHPSAASSVQGKLGASIGAGAQWNFARFELLAGIDGVPLRSQIAAPIDFHEAAAAIRGKDPDSAMDLRARWRAE